MNKAKNKWNKLDENIQKWAKRATAIASIIGVLVAGASWMLSHLDGLFTDKLEQQTSTLQQEVQELVEKSTEREKTTELQLTRLELMMLMETSPTNVVEIEKVAKHYFQDLGGDWYLTSEYSRWASQYGGNVDIAAGVD